MARWYSYTKGNLTDTKYVGMDRHAKCILHKGDQAIKLNPCVKLPKNKKQSTSIRPNVVLTTKIKQNGK